MSNLIVQTLPALYDPLLAEFTKKFDPTYEKNRMRGELSPVEKAKQEFEEIKEVAQPIVTKAIQESQSRPQINTKIIQDLVEQCEIIKKEIKEMSATPQYSSSKKMRMWMDNNTSNFYEYRVKQHARRLEILIDGLINLDGYDEKLFGTYKQLIQLIEKCDGKESVNYLYELVINAQAVIPMSVRYKEDEIIESNNSFADSVVEG